MRINRTYCKHREDSSRRVEFFWNEPVLQNKKYPLIILVHGHNIGLRLGARTDLYTGLFEFFADNDFVSVSMSQPGYGCSDGPPDYCGPFSQAALSSVIDYFENCDFIDQKRIIVYGLSRGATIAAMTLVKDNRIKFGVLTAALYNLVDGDGLLNEGIKDSLQVESKNTEDDLRDRSPIFWIDKINIPVLMIHGALDDIAPFKYADEFYQKAKELNKNIQFELYDEYEHGVPFSICGDLALDFLIRNKVILKKMKPYCLSFKREM